MGVDGQAESGSVEEVASEDGRKPILVSRQQLTIGEPSLGAQGESRRACFSPLI